MQRFSPLSDQALHSVSQATFLCSIWQALVNAIIHVNHELNMEAGPFKAGLKDQADIAARSYNSLAALFKSSIEVLLVAYSGQEKVFNRSLEKALITKKELGDLVGVLSRNCLREDQAKGIVEAARIRMRKLRRSATAYLDKVLLSLTSVVCRVAVVQSEENNTIKSVISVDLSEYGRMMRSLERMVDTAGIRDLNSKIRFFISEAIQEHCSSSDECLWIDSGDGALLVLNDADTAAHVAITLLKNAQRANQSKGRRGISESHFHFRIGISSGRMSIQTTETRDGKLRIHQLAGSCIARAVRLQAKCPLGAVLVCADACKAFESPKNRRRFEKRMRVKGKPYERLCISGHKHEVYSR